MDVYSMSPDAYEGLMKLAKDRRWCADYARIVRYLDVVVSLKEAALLGDEQDSLPPDCATWTKVAFVETHGANFTPTVGASKVIEKP